MLGIVFADALRETDLPPNVREVASTLVDGYADATEGFAFCLSEKGDLLSQWRAYASDGAGISIGFSRDILERDFGRVSFGAQFFDLLSVTYGEESLRKGLRTFASMVGEEFAKYGDFVQLRDGISKQEAQRLLADRDIDPSGLFVGTRDDSLELLQLLVKKLSALHFRIYATKPQSFHEECEWRLIRYQHRVHAMRIEYQADVYSIKPFVSCLIAEPAKEVVQQVILGPRNRSDKHWVRAFLESIGLGHVQVAQSAVKSYR